MCSERLRCARALHQLENLETRTLLSGAVWGTASVDFLATNAPNSRLADIQPLHLPLPKSAAILRTSFNSIDLLTSPQFNPPARASNPDPMPAVFLGMIPVAAPPAYDWHTQVINGVLNVWAPNPSDFGSTFSIVGPSALFGSNGLPGILDIHQGPIADCYLLSPMAALAFTHPSQILADVQNDPAGGWIVSFQSYSAATATYTPIKIHTSNQLSLSQAQITKDDVWPLVIEKAYAAFRTWNGSTSTDTLASIAWGYSSQAMMQLGEKNHISSYTTLTDDSFYTTLQTALASGLPITFQTSSTAPTMVASHVYCITGVSTDASGVHWITTYNPWGFYDTRTIADLRQNGIGTVVYGNV